MDATFSHLTASFIAICLEIKQTTIQPSPRAGWNNHTQTLPPLPAAVTLQTDQWIHSSFSCYSCVISKRLVTHYLQSLFQSCLHCWNIFCALSLLQLCWQRLGWPRQEQNMKFTRLGHGVTPPQAWCISPWIQRTACTDVIASLLYGCDAAAFLCSHWELWFMAAKKQPFQLLCKPYCSAPSCVDASICRLFTCL